MVVVEMEVFLAHAKAILSESERADLVAHLAMNPDAGQLIPGTAAREKYVGRFRERANVVAPGPSTTTTAKRFHCSFWISTPRTRGQIFLKATSAGSDGYLR